MTDEYESEFGQGVVYCLGLYLAHSERFSSARNGIEEIPESMKEHLAGTWINAAGDHIFDLIIPDAWPEHIKKRLSEFKDKIILWRNSFYSENEPAWADIDWSLEEAKSILLTIDKEILNVGAKEAGWK